MKNTFSRVCKPVAAILLVPAFSCGGGKLNDGKTQKGWSKENTIVYQWRTGPDDMHPTNGQSEARRMILDFTQRYILGTDVEKNTLRPDLAKALPVMSPDGLQFTFELREGIRWDDGSPLSMDDILFTYKANVCPFTNNPQAKPYFEFLKQVIPDAGGVLKFTTVMRQPYIQNLAYLVDMPILQRKFHDPENLLAAYTIEQLLDSDFTKCKHADVERWAATFNDQKFGSDVAFLNGLGAYKITNWERNTRIELVRKENPQAGTPQTIYEYSYPEKIILKEMKEAAGVLLELKDQTIDASTWVSTNTLLELQQDSVFNANYNSAFKDNYNYQYIGFNLRPKAANRTELFTDKRVRRAVALLTPIDDIIKTHLYGKAKRVCSYVSPLKAECSKDLVPLPLDVEGAKKLLDEAGWTDTDGDNIRDKMIDGKKTPFVFELLFAGPNPVSEQIVKEIAASCYKAGLKLNYRTMDKLAMLDKINVHEFDTYMSVWGGSFFPEDPKQVWHSSNWANHGSNYVGFGNPLSDRMIDSIRVTMNDSARQQIENRLQHLIYDEQPYIFMYAPQRKMVAHRRFENTAFYFEKPGILLSNFHLVDN